MTFLPRPYQIAGRDFLANRRHALLADQMRVGKTPQAIMAADKVSAESVLILCPAIATYQWRSQWQQWSDREPARILDGTWSPAPDFKGVLISSYTRAMMEMDALKAVRNWDVFIADEAHFAKTPTSKRTSMVYGAKGFGWNANRLWALTGTPAPNHAGEMWAMLRAFGRVRCTYEEFVYHFCLYDPVRDRFHGNKRQHLPELLRLIEPFTLRRTLRQVAPDMPGINYNFFVVQPEGNADLNTDDPGRVSERSRIDVALGKVPVLADEIRRNLDAQEYTQTVVFGYHLDPLYALTEELILRGIDVAALTGKTTPPRRRFAQDGFRIGTVQVVLAQMIAAGTAIDLSAAQHGYFLELDWVPDHNAQAAHRLVNLETKAPVSFDILTWPGTRDDFVQRRILQKVSTAVFKS